MQSVGTTSWQISVSGPEALSIGVYVRAAAGLDAAHPWLPEPVPAVPLVRQATETAARQWERWWDVAVTGREAGWLVPPFETLDAAPALRSEVFRHFHDAVRWNHRRADPTHPAEARGVLLATELVADLERAAGRASAPFALRVTAVPCAGKTMWQLAPDHVLVTEELLADDDAYRVRLGVVVGRLL